MNTPAYKVAQNPTDRLWYVVGYCGKRGARPLYVPISDGQAKRAEASKLIPHLRGAARSAKAELVGGSLAVHS